MLEETIRALKSELPPDVELVAVSKFHPAEAIGEAYRAGQRLFAESRPQELLQKVQSLSASCPDIRWHFIGHLQTNKLKLVLPHVELVQSVDSLRLLQAIQAWANGHDRKVRVLLELHVAAEETKQGFSAAELFAALEQAVREKAFPAVELCGLMGMTTFTEDERVIRRDFSRLQETYREVRARYPELESFKELSIGMSGDYSIALDYGSTMVRIGTKIFGARR